jgi:hypothetical protein
VDSDTNVTIHVEGTITGTGYSFNTWPAILAAAALLLHVFIAFIFMIWSLVTGISSNSWDSAAEVTALALKYTAPASLGHLSAGLETLRIFQQPVRILDDGRNELQLVFTGSSSGVRGIPAEAVLRLLSPVITAAVVGFSGSAS